MLTLIDLCRAAKENRHLTNREIADATGVPLNTVNNMFRASTHSPTVETLGPICAFLGVSIDEFFGKNPPEPEETPPPEAAAERMEHEVSSLHQYICGLNAQNELLREIIEKQTHGIRTRDFVIFCVFALFIGALAYALFLDLHCLDFGLFHS